MQNEIIVRFCIWGFDDVDHKFISAALTIDPTQVYIKGERKNPKFAALANKNGWLVDATTNRNEPFDTQLERLLQILGSKREIVQEFSSKYSCEISCAIFMYFDNGENTPSIHLSPEQIKTMFDLGVEFDIDLYCLPN